MDLVVPIIEIVKLVSGPIVRYLKDQINFNNYLKNFKKLKEKLQPKQQDISVQLRSQLTYGKKAKEEVKQWLDKVEEITGPVAQDIEDKIEKGGCLLRASGSLAKLLKEKIQEMEGLCEDGSKLLGSLVVDDPSTSTTELQTSELQGSGGVKAEILACLKGEKGEMVTNLGVWGMGGVGKTTIKMHVHNELLKEDKFEKFEKVIQVTVSQNFNINNLQHQIASSLGENLQEHESTVICAAKLSISMSTSTTELQTSELQDSGGVKAEILACLKGEEVTKLGVWGMGGVGKTTIMRHVYNELLKEDKFKKVIWVTVSPDFNINSLQQQIACCLGENLQEHESTIICAAKLSKMLEKRMPYLLILDDVWSNFKLEDVGFPEPNVYNGCKLVLTTRLQGVANSMGCDIIKVETLSKDEALKLFLKKVGDAALSCPGGGIKMDLESTLKEIVDECDGHPLALTIVAGSLKGISKLRLWRVALNQLRNCKRNVAGTDVNAFWILKFSYDRLENQQIKDCFLYCALYPEDYKILKEKIIENWVHEGFIDEMESRQSMKDAGYDFLKKLEDNSLLELIEDEVGRACVRMHDLIRDMALHITRTSPRFLVEAGKSLTELPEKVKCIEDAEKVSLMYNSIEEIPSSLAFSTCMRLTTLLLACNKLSTISESVFEHMPELKTLDLSFNWKLSSLPSSISKLVKLTTLLLESTSLEKVPSLSGLGSLKKLNLRGTKIKEVPEGLEMLKNLKCLFLCGSNYDNILEIDEIADGVLSSLSKLQELIVDRSRIKLKGDVVGRLMKLEAFHGWFPTANDMGIFLKWQPDRLSDYFINVGSELVLNDHFERFRPTYKKIMGFRKTSIVGENMLFPSMQALGVEACHDIRSLNDFSTINDAADLRECWIWDCDGMECIFSSWINNPVVQTVECLNLRNLHKLDGLFEANIIAKSSPPPRTFSSLEVVKISSCSKLKKLFSS